MVRAIKKMKLPKITINFNPLGKPVVEEKNFNTLLEARQWSLTWDKNDYEFIFVNDDGEIL